MRALACITFSTWIALSHFVIAFVAAQVYADRAVGPGVLVMVPKAAYRHALLLASLGLCYLLDGACINGLQALLLSLHFLLTDCYRWPAAVTHNGELWLQYSCIKVGLTSGLFAADLSVGGLQQGSPHDLMHLCMFCITSKGTMLL